MGARATEAGRLSQSAINRGTEDIGGALITTFADLWRLRRVTERLKQLEELRLPIPRR
ncbi:MAG: hypothetical protein WA001_01215 [Patescibacteria group bacterium]